MTTHGRVFLGLGSNLGDRQAWIDRGIEHLRRESAFVYLRQAARYETAAMGADAGGPFINTAVAGLWGDTPEALLAACQRIESRCGRERPHPWAPRTLDIDILLWEGVDRRSPLLTIPHPGLHERAFALVPLLELAPDAPAGDRPLRSALTERLLAQGIERVTREVNGV